MLESNTVIERRRQAMSLDALLDIFHSLWRVINEDSNRLRKVANY